MKAALKIFLTVTVMLLTVSIQSSIENRTIRKNEIERATDNACSETMRMVLYDKRFENVEELSESEKAKNNKLMADMVKTCIMRQITSDSRVDVNVIKADCEKGILDVSVKAEFKYINGRTGKIEKRSTVILEGLN